MTLFMYSKNPSSLISLSVKINVIPFPRCPAVLYSTFRSSIKLETLYDLGKNTLTTWIRNKDGLSRDDLFTWICSGDKGVDYIIDLKYLVNVHIKARHLQGRRRGSLHWGSKRQQGTHKNERWLQCTSSVVRCICYASWALRILLEFTTQNTKTHLLQRYF